MTQPTGANATEKKVEEPWTQTWILKPLQAATVAVEEAVKGLGDVKMPWEREWKEKGVKALPKPPKEVDVSTEAKMKVAAVIQPHERMPDTQSAASNIKEIEQEMKKTKDPGVLKILQAEKDKFLRMSKT